MPQNLFAACKDSSGQLIAKRIPLHNNAQNDVITLFNEQKVVFFPENVRSIPYELGWTLDNDQLFYLDMPDDAKMFEDTISVNSISLPLLKIRNIHQEDIKAIFTGSTETGKLNVLVQRFTRRQVLEKKFTLFSDGNTYNKLTEYAFTLETSLTLIIKDHRVFFKNPYNLRSLINFNEINREATLNEIHEFAKNDKIYIKDLENFITLSNDNIRTLIHAIKVSKILVNNDQITIKNAAQDTGIDVKFDDEDRLIIPESKDEILQLLIFLNESRYPGPITKQIYITNSKRKI